MPFKRETAHAHVWFPLNPASLIFFRQQSSHPGYSLIPGRVSPCHLALLTPELWQAYRSASVDSSLCRLFVLAVFQTCGVRVDLGVTSSVHN